MKTKAWLLFGISTCGAVVFATLYFLNPKIVIRNDAKTITNTVTNTVIGVVTNEVVKEVPKEVEKIVTVPAEIPDEYIQAKQIISNYDNCDFVDSHQVLFGMKDVRVVYLLGDAVKQIVSEDDVRARFELTLRRNNVPINPTSQNVVLVDTEGFWGEPPTSENLFTHSVTIELEEKQTLLRGNQLHKALVTVWQNSHYGLVGKYNASNALLDTVEKEGDVFANDFLSANPK
jgi:hypothetical protein